jgi:hypothetical protein
MVASFLIHFLEEIQSQNEVMLEYSDADYDELDYIRKELLYCDFCWTLRIIFTKNLKKNDKNWKIYIYNLDLLYG